ncbi:MAG: glycosyltransferase [Candidatus Paceibacterota bacterium]
MITGVVLARNEEKNIVGCLEALRSHVEEILLIDMESSDATVALAGSFVTRVLQHPFMRNFDSARNIAIPEAKYEWLWFVDADERIPEASGKLVLETIRNHGDEFEALTIPFKSYCCGQWMRHCGWWPGYTGPRVLKRGYFHFATRIHGGVRLDGREWIVAADPKLGIEHYGIQDVQHYVEKVNRYSAAEAENLAQDGRSWNWRAAIGDMMHDLWMTYEQHPGRLDGKRGWVAAWMSGQYRWLAQTKLLDLHAEPNSMPDPGEVPVDLDDAIRCMRDALARLRARRPQLPLGIVWRALVGNESGYAEEARTFLKAVSRNARPVALDDRFVWHEQDAGIPVEDKALFRALHRAQRPQHAIAVTHGVPGMAGPDDRAAINVLRTMIETDRIPAQWIPQIDAFDEVWAPSQHVADALRRSWIASEKIRVLPACFDPEIFRPDGAKFPLPDWLGDKFLFLSVFDWTPRKGGSLLLENYCQEFHADEGVGLLLKLTRIHGQSLAEIREQFDSVLRQRGESLEKRPDIVLLDETLSTEQMASLYRSANAFVLASHGEGWGRPYMEAMASGLPTIGTAATGNMQFMNEHNSLLIPAQQVAVPEQAVHEFPLFAGHRWYEPDPRALRQLMRLVVDDDELRKQIGKRAMQEIHSGYSLEAGAEKVESAVRALEDRLVVRSAPAISNEQIRVLLEGELFAGLSFSNINEHLCRELVHDPSLAFSVKPFQPGSDGERPSFANEIEAFIGRDLPGGPQVTIRHAYPPNWTPPTQGLWVHIQPWEFGHLPSDWIVPLKEHVDEIWVPSHYVRRVYERSGIPAEKIQLIPWGVDPEVFTPAAVPLLMPAGKTFHFLYVGGTVARKGFDRLLAAYLAEFCPEDDVCLVVKDVGSKTAYRNANYQQEILAAQRDSAQPAILYLNRPLTGGQLASLYTACDCLVAPYRGEGFGLPILEAMACGTAPIVPVGGASDDFTTEETAFLLPSLEVEVESELSLCGPCLEHSVRQDDLVNLMRRAVQDRHGTRATGRAAAEKIRKTFSWRSTASRMIERIKALVSDGRPVSRSTSVQARAPAARVSVCVVIVVRNDASVLADTLARLRPFVERIVCLEGRPSDVTMELAKEYGAAVASCPTEIGEECGDWLLRLQSGERVSEDGFRRLENLLASSPMHINAIAAKVVTADDHGMGLCRQTEVRLLRRGGTSEAKFLDPTSPMLAFDSSESSIIADLPITTRANCQTEL